MAKLEAVLDVDTSPFQKKLAQAAEKAREFGKGTAEVGNDLVKTLSGFDIGKILGIGGATYAATKLGDALVDAAKKGLEAFEAYERAVLRFKYVLPIGPGGGAAAGGRAEEIATMAGAKSGLYSAEQMRSAALYLAEASKELRESPEKLNDMLDTLKAFALKTASTPEQIAEAYRRLVVGIKEEGGMAVGRFFKSTPGMEAEVEKLRDAHAEAYLHAQGLGDASQASAAQASEYHRLQTQSVSDFMSEETSRKGATAVLEEIKGILERSAPKGIITEMEAAEPGAMLAKAWRGIEKSFGEELKPAIDGFVKMLMEHMPAIGKMMEGIGIALNVAIEGITPILSNLGKVVEAVLPPFGQLKSILDGLTGNAMANAKALSDHVDEVLKAQEAQKAAREAPEKSATEALMAPTGIFSKERIKAEEEAAKISARADADHAASVRRVSFEAADAELRSAAAVAARRALIDRPRGATELADKQYAADAEAAARIINIKAAASEKANAAEEAAAERIAKIDEEQSLRNIERATASAMDEGAAKEAALARLNALDAAAELARNDAREESAEKIRVADTDAANAIIDAQEEAAVKRIDAEKAAALALLDQQMEVKKEEAPARWETFSKFGPRGEVIEGSADRKAREERNREAEANARREREIRRVGIEREYDERKRQVEDQLEAQRPTKMSLKRTHEIQQEEQVKAIEAEKGRTAADQEFAEAHEKLGLPPEPAEEAKGKADISRKVMAEILTKIWDSINIGNSHFEGVFMSDS
jgi:hypothetical protein